MNQHSLPLMPQKNSTPHIYKWLLSYLFYTGIMIHIAFICALFVPSIIFKEPLGFFLERTANYLYHSGGSAKQRYLGKNFIKYLPINDWKIPQLSQLPLLTSLHDWQGQGASTKITFANQKYLNEKPLPAELNHSISNPEQTKLVYTASELLTAIKHAQAGDTIQLMPGIYNINKRYITIASPGRKKAPIVVRSAQLGAVKINLNTSEGFHIHVPYWVFENLEIQGICTIQNHNQCNHAFHVVGNGHSFVLRNNKIYNFNSAVKVNGSPVNGVTLYPDNGLIEKNSFYNTTRRHTKNPVNTLNINSANNWVVRGNLISDFSKTESNNPVSFGAYMKGNSHNGLFENNLIICEHTIPADIGTRIGLSFGGGGTGKKYCRDQDCSNEHSNGTMRNNIILNCSHDVGIYLNKSHNTNIYNNLIFNSLGIDIRFKTSSANIYNNIISGRIKARDKGNYKAENNIFDKDCIAPDRKFSGCDFTEWYWDITNADTTIRNETPKKLMQGINTDFTTDFCGHIKKIEKTNIGPIQLINNLGCSADTMNKD